MATILATLLLCLLLGALGRAVKPVAFVAVLAPTLAAAVAVMALQEGWSCLAAGALFYAGMAAAELAYLGTHLLGGRSLYRPAQDRSA